MVFGFSHRQFSLEKSVEPSCCWRELVEVGVTNCKEEGMQCIHVPTGRAVKRICGKISLWPLRNNDVAIGGPQEQHRCSRNAG